MTAIMKLPTTAILFNFFAHSIVDVLAKDDVPGCSCPAAACESWMDEEMTATNDLAVCPTGLTTDSFWNNNMTRFPNITNLSTLSFCDAIHADPTFQSTYGTEAGYTYVATDADFGNYLEVPSAYSFGVLGVGTCQDAFEAQSACGITSTTTTTTQMLGLSGFIGTSVILPGTSVADILPQVNVVSC